MAISALVRHVFPFFRSFLLLLSGLTIQLAIECEESPTGRLREMNIQLFEPRSHAVRAKFRSRYGYPPDFSDGLKGHFARWFVWCVRSVVQSRVAFPNPSLEHVVDPLARRAQIHGDAFNIPSLYVQIDNGFAPLIWIRHVDIQRIPPFCDGGRKKRIRQGDGPYMSQES